MKHHRLRFVLLLAQAFLLTGFVFAQGAADYPDKPVRVVSALSTSGGADIVARLISGKLSENMRRQFVVENRLGGGGTVGYTYAAKAPPDGYTLLAAGSGYTIASVLYPVQYDPLKDLIPISQTSMSAYLLVVHPSVPTKSIRELVALAKAKPGALNFGSGGVGSSVHFATETFASAAGIKLTHVPYKGAGEALTDLMRGEIHLVISNTLSSFPLVKAGRLRALAVSSARRSVSLPNIPTISESGVPGFSISTWNAFFAPAGVAPEIMARLNAAILDVLKDPAIAKKMADDGGEPIDTLDQFKQRIRDELILNRKIVKEANIKVE